MSRTLYNDHGYDYDYDSCRILNMYFLYIICAVCVAIGCVGIEFVE